MRLIAILFTTILALPFFTSAQIRGSKTSIYFDNDKANLRDESMVAIENALSNLSTFLLLKVIVTANTDNAADSQYNRKLSDIRAKMVKDFLIKRGVSAEIISTYSFGEDKPLSDNESDEGKQKNRRVDIIIHYQNKPVAVSGAPPDTNRLLLTKIDTCLDRDTVIILPQGTQLVFNTCEYLSVKDCLDFKEANHVNDILFNNMSLMDTGGIPIQSCGMLRLSMKPNCNKKCFDTRVKVRFPYVMPGRSACEACAKNAQLYDINNNGLWAQSIDKSTPMKMLTIGGKIFYQFELICPDNWKNCDCKTPVNPVTFKTRKGYSIVSIKIISECPITIVDVKPGKNATIAHTNIPCWEMEKYVEGTFLNKAGDTLLLPKQPLNNLPKRIWHSSCAKIKGQIIGRWLGIFPIAKRAVYRKYIVKPKLLKLKVRQ